MDVTDIMNNNITVGQQLKRQPKWYGWGEA